MSRRGCSDSVGTEVVRCHTGALSLSSWLSTSKQFSLPSHHICTYTVSLRPPSTCLLNTIGYTSDTLRSTRYAFLTTTYDLMTP